jgi:hypothetical protein
VAIGGFGSDICVIDRRRVELAAAANKLAVLGKSIGPPWGKDQKSAARAAAIVLHECSGSPR